MPMPLVRRLLAEFLGTMILVVVAVGVATESFGFRLFGGRLGLGITGSIAAGVVATALAFGLVLVALVYAIGPISGCHINPAVTLGFIGSGRMKLVEGVEYLVAQFAGGIVGAYLLYWMFTTSPLYHKSVQGLGTDGYGSQSLLHVSEGGAFLIEVVLTAIFVTVVLFATHKAAIQGAAGVAIGFALLMVHLIGIPLTGTSVNPARSLGPALVVGGTALSQVWLFVVAPLVGALVAALIHLGLTYGTGESAAEVSAEPAGAA
jgi:aquaporin Z